MQPINIVFLSTIDVDYNPKKGIDKHKLMEMIEKIKRQPCCGAISAKPSDSKGYHITIGCKIQNCPICRMVFDDQVRFAKDSRRPPYAQNVLFDKKHIPAPQYL